MNSSSFLTELFDPVRWSMMLVRPASMIISCNSLTNVSDEKDLDIFYNELSSLIRSKHNVLIIGGEMNAQIGKKKKKKKKIQLTQHVKEKWGTPNRFLTIK